ncbi:hypothetical protein NDU88_001459 [Pleurodeles waltl]|uniref:Uncharacterized protein n=1 Tax=Pleurodeles waltl TaxID=8319 RepID=A0AAV7LXP3_PLEWA|nr:hypothetical protein NDU88_001459 [Pleurodeles waltl]
MKEHQLKMPTKLKGNDVSKPCGNDLVNEATKKPNSRRPSIGDASEAEHTTAATERGRMPQECERVKEFQNERQARNENTGHSGSVSGTQQFTFWHREGQTGGCVLSFHHMNKDDPICDLLFGPVELKLKVGTGPSITIATDKTFRLHVRYTAVYLLAPRHADRRLFAVFSSYE